MIGLGRVLLQPPISRRAKATITKLENILKFALPVMLNSAPIYVYLGVLFLKGFDLGLVGLALDDFLNFALGGLSGGDAVSIEASGLGTVSKVGSGLSPLPFCREVTSLSQSTLAFFATFTGHVASPMTWIIIFSSASSNSITYFCINMVIFYGCCLFAVIMLPVAAMLEVVCEYLWLTERPAQLLGSPI